MIKHYLKYYWKAGKPYGKEQVNSDAEASYKIVVDPYYKRFSLEKYCCGKFERVLYDSALLDFRHLTLKGQTAWQREDVLTSPDTTTSLIRNQEDRIIVVERHEYIDQRCKWCLIESVHGILLAKQRMCYSEWGDPFDGVVFFDIENSVVMVKKYDRDPHTNEFGLLIYENWNMENECPHAYTQILDTKQAILSKIR